jgi:tetratricopeptide (TPR) repeat protein
MKIRTLAFMFMASFVTTAMAQFEGVSVDERIAATAGEDSIAVGRGHISSFQMGIENKNWKDAHISWKWLMNNAPFAVSGLYKGHAPFMLYQLIVAEQDPVQKLAYFNDLMDMFDKRALRLDTLNSMEKRENLKSTLGDVLAIKADYYNWTAPSTPNSGYTLNKSYKNYSDAIRMINEKGGREVEGSVLQNFFLTSDAMYKSAPNTLREQYLQDYLDSKDACETMLQLAKEAQANGEDAKAQKILAKYEGPLALIEQTFANSGAADPEQIVAIYTKKFNEYKSDIAKLNSSLNLMAQNGCDNDSIYFVYAKAAYDIEPTFTAAIGLAQKAQKDGKAAEALSYYNKALELASDDATRGKICIKIGQALISSGGFAKGEEYFNKAIEFNPSLTGAAYWQLAVSLIKAHDLKGAIDYCDKAGEADITYANRAADMKKRLNDALAQQASNAKMRAEYEEYMRKKKAEEAFWNQK